ncbi:hypothetical protein BS78_10G244700 [Paspalum vaginatum]|nr:hypothetical protein BS78_10G244700 [Paspalum vaginatum]
MAQGAVDSLLGRLTALLIDEAQMLGDLRGDVQFIRDEMESMNSLLLHLTEAQHGAHHVRTWMGQVSGLARDCEAYVQLYLRRVGGPVDAAEDPSVSISCLLAHLRPLLRLLRTVPAHHQIATQVRELKVRAKDVGDRRVRYGISVPDSAAAGDGDIYDGDAQFPWAGAGEEEDLRRRAILLFEGAEPPVDVKEVIEKDIDTLFKCLSREPSPPPAATARARQDGEPPVRVFCITGARVEVVNPLRFHTKYEGGTFFDFKAWVRAWYARPVLASILEDNTGAHPEKEVYKSYLGSPWLDDYDEEEDYRCLEEELIRQLQGHLKGKRFLIVNENREEDERKWRHVMDALLDAASGCRPGSAIVMITEDNRLALSSSPIKIINGRSLVQVYMNRAKELIANQKHLAHLKAIFEDIYPNAFAMKAFLHLIYVNPNRTDDEVQKFGEAISECKSLKRSISHRVLMWCYNELLSKYRSCLLYLSIFPQDYVIRTISLTRRWVAEGLITPSPTSAATASDEVQSSTDEAEHYLEVLFMRGFLSPLEISAAGDIKSCTVHHQVREFIARVSRDVNYVDTSRLTGLAHHLSIHSTIVLQKSHSADGANNGIVSSLPSLASSPQRQLLKVLDLMGCKGLKKKHLKSICKILLLKYLSLRNTDVTELPKQIKEL